MATAEYCERCKCRTLHVPMPSGERRCEYHLDDEPTPLGTPPAPARERQEHPRR